MTWQEWLEQNQYDIDFGDDTIDLMKQAYIAGLQTAYDIMYSNEDGDYDFIMWSLKRLINENK